MTSEDEAACVLLCNVTQVSGESYSSSSSFPTPRCLPCRQSSSLQPVNARGVRGTAILSSSGKISPSSFVVEPV